MLKNKISHSKYKRGSEWRRWDLHVHTPESRLGAAFRGIEMGVYLKALDKSAKENHIAVIGITDYLSIDGYEKVYEASKNGMDGLFASVELLIPNIELRATPNTESGKALNIHLLVDPSDPEHINKIKQALRNLKFEYRGQRYGCIREELIQYGKAQNSKLDEEGAYKFGIEQFKPSYQTIKDWLESEGWLKNNSLLAIANGKDGISGLPLDGFNGVREELIGLCHIIFSANPEDVKYYLGKKEGTPPEKIKEMYGGLKPCLHGSDAHKIEELFKPNSNRFCWIKADPTFEGLRQVLWEPEERVYIGPTKNEPFDLSRVIRKVSLENTQGWFTQSEINLNFGLVAIIGEKGAGKTAIADLIAFAAGAKVDEKSQSSFINKGSLHLDGLKVQLCWGSGATTVGRLNDEPYLIQKPLVRYLSQDFVERLCSDDHDGNELQEAIEEVVFSHLDEIQREGFSSFKELRSAREESSQVKQDSFRGNLASLHREIERLYLYQSQKPEKEALKSQTQKQIEVLKKQLPTAQKTVDAKVLKLLEESNELKERFEAKLSEFNRVKRILVDFRSSHKLIQDRTNLEIKNLIEIFPDIKIINNQIIFNAYPTWNEGIAQLLENEIKKIDDQILLLQGNESDGIEIHSLFGVKGKIKKLQKDLSEDESNKNRLIEIQKQINSQELIVKRIQNEIDEIDNKIARSIEHKTNERFGIYVKYFEALAEDEKGLRDLYAPMRDRLSVIDSDMKFELSAGYKIDVKDWMEKSSRFFDGRKPNALTKKNEIDKFVLDKLVSAWASGDTKNIDTTFNDFVKIINPVEFMKLSASPSLKLIDLFDWMYSIDHIKATYKIHYGQTPLEHLSPGTRGIALLVLYLLMDEDDRRPLIIDQPEGNLDNSSIYLQLVPYIRRAKQNRQIILITHNPNLVVATDAEQIIVAIAERAAEKSYPSITYASGSIEHSVMDEAQMGTRQIICTLLEGGDKAFKERESKYAIRF